MLKFAIINAPVPEDMIVRGCHSACRHFSDEMLCMNDVIYFLEEAELLGRFGTELHRI